MPLPRLSGAMAALRTEEGKAVSRSPRAQRGSGGWKANLASEHHCVSLIMDVVKQGGQALVLVT